MVEDKNDVGRMCERMEISEQDLLLALDRYMQKNDLTFRRFYHKKFHMYFFEMRQPLSTVVLFLLNKCNLAFY